MKSFVIFAVIVTVIYAIYYTVVIMQDLYGKPKDEKTEAESFDVSDMTDEEESVAVSESDGGFSVGDDRYETAYEEKQLAEPQESGVATGEAACRAAGIRCRHNGGQQVPCAGKDPNRGRKEDGNRDS